MMSVKMKSLSLVLLFMSVASIASGPEEKVPDNLINRCEKDVKRLCTDTGDTTLSLMMCLLAKEDDLSPACREDMLEAAASAIAGPEVLDYSISACEKDVGKYCSDVPPGEGRVLGCIRANESTVSEKCITALKETGLWELGEQ
jgi:hypothetical protein